MSNIDMSNMSNMKVYTCFNSSSLHSYSPLVLKSGICKYTRRSEYKKYIDEFTNRINNYNKIVFKEISM